jgi:hypothetical protein
MGTDSTERGRTMWAKGGRRTRCSLPFKAAYMLRPESSSDARIKSRTTLYRVFYSLMTPLYPALRSLFPGDHDHGASGA